MLLMKMMRTTFDVILRTMLPGRGNIDTELMDKSDDLLSHLMNATDPETGKSMNTIDVRNNLMTFITAGHETTALTLTS